LVFVFLANPVSSWSGAFTVSLRRGGGGGEMPDSEAAPDNLGDMNLRTLPRVQAGQVINGQLTRSDFLRSDNSYADGYVYQGRAGELLTITMSSSDFDAWLVLDEPDGPLREHDDDSGGGTNSRISVRLPRSGTYLIVANSVGQTNTGSYRLSVQSQR
jgi:hypothetical protein